MNILMVQFVMGHSKGSISMTQTKVYLRADGNAEIGMGHLVRTLALGQAMTDTFECHFFTSESSSLSETDVKRIPFDTNRLSEKDHFDEFLDLLSGNEIVVLDNYFFGAPYQEKLKEKGCLLVSIDDLHKDHFFSDVIINHSPSAKLSDYSIESYTQLLLGLDYVLLRSEILNYVRNPSEPFTNDYILICFGGSDFYNLSEKYLKEIKVHYPNVEVRIIIGGAYQGIQRLEKTAKEYNNVSIHQNLSVREMIKLISGCKLAVVSASTIMLETIALKKPFLSGYYADNQIEIANSFENYNFCEIVGDLRAYSLSSHILENLSGNEAPNLIDGLSYERIKAELCKLVR